MWKEVASARGASMRCLAQCMAPQAANVASRQGRCRLGVDAPAPHVTTPRIPRLHASNRRNVAAAAAGTSWDEEQPEQRAAAESEADKSGVEGLPPWPVKGEAQMGEGPQSASSDSPSPSTEGGVEGLPPWPVGEGAKLGEGPQSTSSESSQASQSQSQASQSFDSMPPSVPVAPANPDVIKRPQPEGVKLSTGGGGAPSEGGLAQPNPDLKQLESPAEEEPQLLLPEVTTATAVDTESEPPRDAPEEERKVFEFACPICQTTTFGINSQPTRSEGLRCSRCSRTFNASEKFLDLTLSSGVRPRVFQRKEWAGTEMFRNPLVSFAYERGWRQGFIWAGFPGVDREYDLAMDYLRPAYGSVLVDMSCGSGLFSRRFAQSGKFSGIIAADFSESMLEQARAYFKEDGTMGGVTPVTLLRADVGRLPFPTGSVAAIHAGAAIHCWPNPQAALAEISRVLRPGGVFVASTFLAASAPLGQALGNDDLVRPLNQLDPTKSSAYRWWEEDELRDLCAQVGLLGFRRTRSWRFIMFSAKKPEGPGIGEDKKKKEAEEKKKKEAEEKKKKEADEKKKKEAEHKKQKA